MPDAAVRGKIIDIVGAVTRAPVDRDGDVSRRSLSAWDSLAHVEILYTVEEAFGVEFDDVAMAHADSVDALTAEVARLRGAA